jgi:hypothetical protein
LLWRERICRDDSVLAGGALEAMAICVDDVVGLSMDQPRRCWIFSRSQNKSLIVEREQGQADAFVC